MRKNSRRTASHIDIMWAIYTNCILYICAYVIVNKCVVYDTTAWNTHDISLLPTPGYLPCCDLGVCVMQDILIFAHCTNSLIESRSAQYIYSSNQRRRLWIRFCSYKQCSGCAIYHCHIDSEIWKNMAKLYTYI